MFSNSPLLPLDFFCKTTIIFSHEKIKIEIFTKKFLPLNNPKRKTFSSRATKKFSKKFIFNHLCPTKHVANTAIPRIISENSHTKMLCLRMAGKEVWSAIAILL
jgi:hypothetical protein